MTVEINYLAVLVAGVASMIVGFLWYSKVLFGKTWAQLKGYTEGSMAAAQAGMGKFYFISFVLSLLMAYMLSHVMFFSEAFFGSPMVHTGLTSAFFSWLGFVMPVQFTAQIFGERKWKLLLIDTGYQLVSLLVMGVVIGLMA